MTMATLDFQRINDLAAEYKAGDAGAADQLMEAAYPFIGWVIARSGYFLPSRGEREDMVQEGMIGVFEALEDWKPELGAPFTSFAKLCVERQLKSEIKAQHRDKRKANHEASSLNAPAHRDKHGHSDQGADDRLSRWDLPDASGIGANPADVAAGDEATELLAALCEGLSVLERAALVRILALGQAYDVVAGALAVPVKALDNAVQRVRKKLARQAERVAASTRLTEETRALLRNTARLAAQPRKQVSDEELRASLPMELLRPAGLGRFARARHQWTVPADQLLAVYPDLLTATPAGVKREVLVAYLECRPWQAIASQLGISISACKHHLRRLCEQAARRHGIERPLVTARTPLLQRVEQLWLKGLPIKQIELALAHVATAGQIQAAINQTRNRRTFKRLREVPREVETRRIPLVRLNRIPTLLRKAKDLLIPAYQLTLKLYMQGYSQAEIAERRGVAVATIGKTDLPLIRRALKAVPGFEWLHDAIVRERQIRLLALEALGMTPEHALARVPAQHRELYRLYLDGLAHKEIDRRLGLRAGAAEKNLHYCRTCVRRPDDFRQHMGRHKTAERYAAKRLRSHAELYRRFLAFGNELTSEQHRLLEQFFAGISMGAIAEMFGRADTETAKQTMWARVVRLEAVLTQLEAERAPAAQRPAAGRLRTGWPAGRNMTAGNLHPEQAGNGNVEQGG